MKLWHRLSPFGLTDVGTEVGRTPGPDIGYNRIELTLSGGVDYCFVGGKFRLSNALVIGLDQMGT